jgi:glutaconate CoA-transferase subunit B
MCLVSVHPGVTVDDVGEQVAWDLRVAPEVEETAPPSENELRLLREELDPKGIFLGSRD